MRKRLFKLASAALVLLLSFSIISANTFAAADRPVLRKGMTGSSVKTLQSSLKKLGFFSTSPTGYYGDLTVSSVKKFQKKYGIPSTGVVATLTYNKLDALLKQAAQKKAAASAPVKSPSSKPNTTAATKGQTSVPAKGTQSQPATKPDDSGTQKPDASKSESKGLKMGLTSPEVLKLQNDLTSLGYMKVKPTGNFGSITENALYQFQKYYGIKPNGIADDKTLSVIDRLLGRNDNPSRGGDIDRGETNNGGTDLEGSTAGSEGPGGTVSDDTASGGITAVAVNPLYEVKKEWITGLPKIPFIRGVAKYEGVVIHYTASPGDTARLEANHEKKYWSKAFVHEFIDATEIIQVADPDYKSWGAGEPANDRFIHLELCDAANQEDFDISFDKITQRAAEYLYAHQLGVSPAKADKTGTLWGHFQVSEYLGSTNHSDPVAYLAKWGKSWNDVINIVTEKYNSLASAQAGANNSSADGDTLG